MKTGPQDLTAPLLRGHAARHCVRPNSSPRRCTGVMGTFVTGHEYTFRETDAAARREP